MGRSGWAVVAAVVHVAGGSGKRAAPPADERLATALGRVERTVPGDHRREEESPLHVQASSGHGRATAGAFELLRLDLAAEVGPHEILGHPGDWAAAPPNSGAISRSATARAGR